MCVHSDRLVWNVARHRALTQEDALKALGYARARATIEAMNRAVLAACTRLAFRVFDTHLTLRWRRATARTGTD
jgi:hypothetical protein